MKNGSGKVKNQREKRKMDKFDATLIVSLGKRLKKAEELLHACQQTTQRQRIEIEALRKLLDDFNEEEISQIEWTLDKIIEREA